MKKEMRRCRRIGRTGPASWDPTSAQLQQGHEKCKASTRQRHDFASHTVLCSFGGILMLLEAILEIVGTRLSP